MEQNAVSSKLKITTSETPTVEVDDDKTHSQAPILLIDDEKLELTNKSLCIEITKEEALITVIPAEEYETVLKKKVA